MTSPEVADAVPRLVEAGEIQPGQAELLLRDARAEVISVRGELRALLYLGVLLVTAGVGWLVKENLDRIGPLGIALGIGLGAGFCLGWVLRRAEPFSWGPVGPPHLALDYLLLLGVLLAAADLGYIEWKFTTLGEAWPWHLLIVALGAGFAAFRFDSKMVFSLALSSFAAWRGVSVSVIGSQLFARNTPLLRWNSVACGLLFVGLGAWLVRSGRKPHFEPVAVHLGWLLILVAIATGLGADGSLGQWYGLLLLTVGSALAFFAFRRQRFPLFAFGVLGAYAGLSRLAIELFREGLGCFWFAATSIALIVLLIVAQRQLKKAP